MTIVMVATRRVPDDETPQWQRVILLQHDAFHAPTNLICGISLIQPMVVNLRWRPRLSFGVVLNGKIRRELVGFYRASPKSPILIQPKRLRLLDSDVP